MKLTKIYEIAEKNNIEITYASLPLNGCLSFKYKNEYHIGIDPEQIKSTADECVKLAHDIGHCVTDSFYNKYSPLDLRSKHEYKAKAWAIKTLMPFDKLKAVMKKGYEQPWELAEYFNVTEDFVHKALEYYESDFIEDKMKNFQKEKEKECIFLNLGLADILLEAQKDLIVPLKQVEKEEAVEKDNVTAKIGYRVINKTDDNGNQISEFVTVDFEKYETYRDDNELIIRVKNMRNLKIIKNCAVFFAVLAGVEIVAGLIYLLILLS